jgi:asparagine synthetase B (glutamine-hydrolysing)
VVDGVRAVIFGSDFHAVCTHVAGESAFDGTALFDLLTYGYLRDIHRTGVEGIQRVPPGHELRVDRSGDELRPFWTFDSRPASNEFSPDALLRLIRTAITESSPATIDCISLSGGLDSSSVAALAVEEGLLNADCAAVTFAESSEDEEFRVAEQTAESLGLQHHWEKPGEQDSSDVRHFLSERARTSATPVSFSNPTSASVGANPSLVLTGFGGDPLQKLNLDHLRAWRSRAGLLAAGRGYWSYWKDEQRVPPLFIGERIGREQHQRWQPWQISFLKHEPPAFSLPESQPGVSPRGGVFGSPVWTALLESRHWSVPGVAGCYADPLLDWKLAEYLEAIPAIPWLVRKKALRTAMRGKLPEPVLDRRKTVHQRARVERTISEQWKHPAVYEEIRLLIRAVGDDPYLDLPAVVKTLDVPNPPRWWSFRLRRIGSYLKWKRDLMELGVG